MKPEYLILAAIVLIAIIALAKGGKKDKKARSFSTQRPRRRAGGLRWLRPC